MSTEAINTYLKRLGYPGNLSQEDEAIRALKAQGFPVTVATEQMICMFGGDCRSRASRTGAGPMLLVTRVFLAGFALSGATSCGGRSPAESTPRTVAEETVVERERHVEEEPRPSDASVATSAPEPNAGVERSSPPVETGSRSLAPFDFDRPPPFLHPGGWHIHRFRVECEHYALEFRFPYSEAETKAIVAEILGAYDVVDLVGSVPARAWDLRLGVQRGGEAATNRGTTLRADCADSVTCQVVAAILTAEDLASVGLECGGIANEGVFEAWSEETLDRAQLKQTKTSQLARAFYCTAHELGWVNGTTTSESIDLRCASESTCLEVARCIEPHEQAHYQQVRPISRPTWNKDGMELGVPRKPADEQ
jgi:hypothetical protein